MQLVPDTESQPDQPVKIEPPSGAATRVTRVIGMVFGTAAVHPEVEPDEQEIPASAVMVPLPLPAVRAVSR